MCCLETPLGCLYTLLLEPLLYLVVLPGILGAERSQRWMLLVLAGIVGGAAIAILSFKADPLSVVLLAYLGWVLACNLLPGPRVYLGRRRHSGPPRAPTGRRPDADP